MNEIQEYIAQNEDLLNLLLSFLDNQSDPTDDLEELITFIQKNSLDTEIFRTLLHIISCLSKNHHRDSNFYPKIEKIIFKFKVTIKQSLTNLEIYKIFEEDNLILLFLFEHKVITLDQEIFPIIMKKSDSNRFKVCHKLYPVIKDIIGKRKRKRIEFEIRNLYMKNLNEFESNLKSGQNDSHICYLIRNGLVKEFITYVNQTNIPLSSIIKPSIFETNRFLQERETTLIEYAAFFGSIEIFQYLINQKVELTPSLWLYAIHSNNAELIHLLEEYHIKPENGSFHECLNESIKCHHNEIAEYIQSYLINEDKNEIVNEKETKLKDGYEIKLFENDLNRTAISAAFCSYNFAFFPKSFDDKYILFHLCKYNYIYLVKLLLKSKDLDINISVI
ncbi:hypothetical protein M9Y10_026207 [Tritrichomonas musculus]|uniref:DUF3447 domain-containing protein n=1 Tax=Tritrichomonas musculus TaxID=1915356 RepID=A0ABR2H6Z0_9EUKA